MKCIIFQMYFYWYFNFSTPGWLEKGHCLNLTTCFMEYIYDGNTQAKITIGKSNEQRCDLQQEVAGVQKI